MPPTNLPFPSFQTRAIPKNNPYVLTKYVEEIAGKKKKSGELAGSRRRTKQSEEKRDGNIIFVCKQ